MKKIISLALAASMVAGMAVTSFAVATDPKTEPYLEAGNTIYAWGGADTAMGIKNSFIEFDPDSEEADYGSYYGVEINPNGIPESKMSNYAAYAQWFTGKKFIDGDPILKKEKKEMEAPTYQYTNAAFEAGDEVVVKYTTTEAGKTLAGQNNPLDAGVLVEFTMKLDTKTYSSAELAAKRDAIIEVGEIVATKADKGALKGYVIADMTKTDRNALKAAAAAAFDANYVKGIATEGKYEYKWFVTFNTVWSSEFKNYRDVRGELTVAKRTIGARDNFKLKATDPVRAKIVANVDFNGIHTDIADFYTLLGEVEDLEFDGCVFTVDTVGMSGTKLYRWNGTGFNKEIVAKFPNAVLSFFDFKDAKNPTFNRTGTLAFYTTDKNAKVYEILADGSLKLVESKYDEKMESVTIKTRTLGNYVVSDIELVEAPVVDAPVVDAPVDDVKPNPETGR
ncbi:MAG: hypothetical protein RSF40_09105 [Oscillospiraceae bacterium]